MKGELFTLKNTLSEERYRVLNSSKGREISEVFDWTNLKTVYFCGTLDDYTKNGAVTGTLSFEVLLSSFAGESFFLERQQSLLQKRIVLEKQRHLRRRRRQNLTLV